MSLDEENRNAPSEKNNKEELLQQFLKSPPALSPMQNLLQQVENLVESHDRVAKATQHNETLLIDAVANLEMRLNLAMAIIRDLANQQVKFEGKEQHRKDNRVIDMAWYYETYMARLREEEAKAKVEAVPSVEKPEDFPKDAVIFGGGN
jgi:hypothetical protein